MYGKSFIIFDVFSIDLHNISNLKSPVDNLDTRGLAKYIQT